MEWYFAHQEKFTRIILDDREMQVALNGWLFDFRKVNELFIYHAPYPPTITNNNNYYNNYYTSTDPPSSSSSSPLHKNPNNNNDNDDDDDEEIIMMDDDDDNHLETWLPDPLLFPHFMNNNNYKHLLIAGLEHEIVGTPVYIILRLRTREKKSSSSRNGGGGGGGCGGYGCHQMSRVKNNGDYNNDDDDINDDDFNNNNNNGLVLYPEGLMVATTKPTIFLKLIGADNYLTLETKQTIFEAMPGMSGGRLLLSSSSPPPSSSSLLLPTRASTKKYAGPTHTTTTRPTINIPSVNKTENNKIIRSQYDANNIKTTAGATTTTTDTKEEEEIEKYYVNLYTSICNMWDDDY